MAISYLCNVTHIKGRILWGVNILITSLLIFDTQHPPPEKMVLIYIRVVLIITFQIANYVNAEGLKYFPFNVIANIEPLNHE